MQKLVAVVVGERFVTDKETVPYPQGSPLLCVAYVTSVVHLHASTSCAQAAPVHDCCILELCELLYIGTEFLREVLSPAQGPARPTGRSVVKHIHKYSRGDRHDNEWSSCVDDPHHERYGLD